MGDKILDSCQEVSHDILQANRIELKIIEGLTKRSIASISEERSDIDSKIVVTLSYSYGGDSKTDPRNISVFVRALNHYVLVFHMKSSFLKVSVSQSFISKREYKN